MRTAGFRLSALDAAVLVAGAAAFVLGAASLGPIAGVIAMAVGHFFLFCNVFRLRRRYELGWTAVFVANFTAWTFATDFSWAGVLAVQLPATALVIALELRSPRYHGVLAERINPRLAEYPDGRIP